MNGISVADALTLLADYDIEVLAGKNGLARVIQQVSVLEIFIQEESPNWLSGGELVLSVLNAYKTPQEIVGIIRYLTRANAAALLVHPAANKRVHLDKSVLEAAEQLDFPLLTVSQHVPYVGILTAVYGQLLNKQAGQLAKSEKINRHLTSLLISGGNAQTITNALANILHKPVLLLDENDQEIARNNYSSTGGRLIDFFLQGNVSSSYESAHYKSGFYNIYQSHFIFEGENYQQTTYRIYFIDDLLGSIMIWHNDEGGADRQEHQIDFDALSHAATALALLEMKHRAATEATERQVQAFFDDLLNQRFESEDSMLIRAEALNIPARDGFRVVIVDLDDFELFCRQNAQMGEGYFQEIKKYLGHTIKTALLKLHDKSTLIPVSDCFVALIPTGSHSKEAQIKSCLQEIFAYIRQAMQQKYPAITITTGAGSQYPLLRLAKSYEEARKACNIGCKVYGKNGAYFYEDLGIYGLFTAGSSGEMRDYCQGELARLLKSSPKSDENLLDTIEAFLDCNESLLLTAERLDIHPNTVKYRLQKAKRLFGSSFLENNEEKLKMHVVLKIRKLF